jgi:hypothetical protein
VLRNKAGENFIKFISKTLLTLRLPNLYNRIWGRITASDHWNRGQCEEAKTALIQEGKEDVG